MKYLTLIVALLISANANAEPKIEGFIYVVSTPAEIELLSGIPSHYFSKNINWQYPIGKFNTAQECKAKAIDRLADISRPSEGWMCGVKCKTDVDLNIRICTVVIEE